MLRIRMMASGEEIAAIEQDQVQSMTEAPGGPVRGLKSYLWSRLGIPRFRQRLLTQSGDILGDAANIQSLSDLQLVLLQFLSTSERQADELCRSVGIASRLRHLLQMPLDPDSRNSRGFAALHLAATRGSLPALSLLLEAGADPDVAGATPLRAAEASGASAETRAVLARADSLRSAFQRDNKRLGELRARERTEQEVAKQYEKLHELASALLLCIAPGDLGREEVGGKGYGFLEFQGRQVGNDKGDDLGDRLSRQRARDLRSSAKDALCAVLSCLCCRTEKVSVSAMFKKGSKQLVEDHLDGQMPVTQKADTKEPKPDAHVALDQKTQKQDFPTFPPLGNIDSIIKSAQDSINKTIESGKEAVEGAVEGAKTVALDVLEAGAEKVNETLDKLGGEVSEANSTALSAMEKAESKVKMADNKAEAFADAGKDLLQSILPKFQELVSGLHGAMGAADKALDAMDEKPAAKKLDDAMSPVFATIDSWKNSASEVIKTLSAYASQVSGAGNASNASNASLLDMGGPEAKLADALRDPLEGLKLAAGQLHNLANDTFDAMNNFVDAGLDAASGKLPDDLIANVSDIFEGVQEKARLELEPIGAVGDEIVNALYNTAQELRAWLEDFDDERPVRGYFAHALVEASSRFRIAMGTGPRAASRLACLLVTFEMPFGKALEHMDFAGPLPAGHLRAPRARRQYALQEIAVEGGRSKERLRPAETLKPEQALKAALYNETPAILLDVYAALAPRLAVKEHGLGEVVKAEFVGLLRRAKEERKILIFMLGGPSPVELAEKVYLKDQYVAMGLRCGYLRWRESPDHSWRRQKCYDQRLILGLMMP
ncbi:unnamed protein product [Symbiodinium natans]|uniref:Ubiquitin-like domain-containing protein n=1 Tax=Symbiodinium natans TaxID=878477 RepID=A0A812M6U5_9DINO|nr:unnamed protein product [Symbiodinium natans]